MLVVAALGRFMTVTRHDSSPRPIRTVRLEKGDLLLSVPATGIIEPRDAVEIKSKASGEIAKILAEEGSRVNKGDVIIEIDPSIEKIGVRRAEADLMAAMASVQKAEILLEKSKLAWSRKEKLHSKGLISEEEAEGTRQDVALREADLSLAKAQRLREEVALSEAGTRLTETRVRAPLSGMVLSLDVRQGQIISSGISSFSQGTALAVIGDLSQLRIRAEVDEIDARKVAVGQAALVHFDAFPEQTFKAHVIRVAPLAKIKNDLAVVDLLLSLDGPVDSADDPSPLRPGLSADVEIVTQQLEGVPLLSREAVHRKGGRWGVSVLRDKAVFFHEVGIGESDGERIEIKTDLPIGTEVALNDIVPGGSSPENSGRLGRP